MATQVITESLHFTSVAAAKRHFSAMLNRYNIGEQVSERDNSELCEIIQRHPKYAAKISKGVRGFLVGKDGYGHRCFFIITDDGSTIDISVVKTCCSGKEPTLEMQFSSACRSAIRDDLREHRREWFQQNGDVNCSVSGLPISMSNSHVDHAPPTTFSTVVLHFRAGVFNGKLSENLFESGETSGTVTRFADPALAERFRRWHEDVAEGRLRVIHASANRRGSLHGRLRDDPNTI